MFGNIPETIQGYEIRSVRPNFIERFDDGTGFVFSPQSPFGVKYLRKQAFDAYIKLVDEFGNPPLIDVDKAPEYLTFVKHGLANSTSGIQVERKPKPKAFTVWFHISNACNLACSYCYIPKLMKAADLSTMDKYFMPEETAIAATENLFQFCVENNFTHLQIKFAGGEPTLNPTLIASTCELANRLSEQYNVKIGFRILTNGVFVDDYIFDVFKQYKFGVSISVDGDEERHDEIRFTLPRSRVEHNSDNIKEGSWSTINYNIDRLLANGIKPYILCTITHKNYKHLFKLVEYCVSKRIGFRLSPVRDKGSHLRDGLEEDILKELISIYDWIGNNIPYSMPIERFARFAEWNLLVQKQSVCGTCKSTMSIDQDGNVASCQMRMNKPYGNVSTNTLTDIFTLIKSSEDNTYLTAPDKKTKDCSICYWKYTCAGGCPEHTRTAMGTVNSPSPWCNLYQGLLPYYLKAIASQIKRAIDIQ